MDNFYTKVKESFILNTLWSMFRFVFTSIIAVIIHQQTGELIYSLVFIVIIAIIIIAIRVHIRKMDFKYIFLRKNIYFEYHDKKYTYKYDINVRSLINNLEIFNGRITSSLNNSRIKCIKPINSKIEYLVKDDIYNKYMIIFNRKYNAGDVFDIEVESLMNEELKFPAFSTIIVKPTHYLEIKVKLPISLLESDIIRCKIIPNPSEVGLTQTKEVRLCSNGTYVWSIIKPKLKYEYSIEWDFIESKSNELAVINKEIKCLKIPLKNQGHFSFKYSLPH